MSSLSAITRLSSIAFMFGSSDVAPPSRASISATTLAAKLPAAAYSTANFKSTGGLHHETAVVPARPSGGTFSPRQAGKRSSMTASRQLRLNAFMRPATIHTGAWRYPGAFPDANFNFAHIKRFAQTLERGRFDAFFMADHLAVLNMPLEALKRSHTVTSYEPFTLL